MKLFPDCLALPYRTPDGRVGRESPVVPVEIRLPFGSVAKTMVLKRKDIHTLLPTASVSDGGVWKQGVEALLRICGLLSRCA